MDLSYLYTNADFHEALKPLFRLMSRPEYREKVLIVKCTGAEIYDKRGSDTVVNTINYEQYLNMRISPEGKEAFKEASESVISTVNDLVEKIGSMNFFDNGEEEQS